MIIENSVKVVAEWLLSARHATSFTGAGISTPSGIPDFRSPDSGLWTHADPMAVASIFGFRQNPKAFYDWVRPLAQKTLDAKPNPAHFALAQLEAEGHLQSIITQNIDMLHTLAGSKLVYELHGHMRDSTCIQCFKVYPLSERMLQFLESAVIPRCEMCNGILKPNVILFGEQLPYKELQGARSEAKKCDLMLVVGSSLEVEPASELPMIAKRNGAKVVIINLEATFFDRHADLVLHGDAAVLLPRIVNKMKELA